MKLYFYIKSLAGILNNQITQYKYAVLKMMKCCHRVVMFSSNNTL